MWEHQPVTEPKLYSPADQVVLAALAASALAQGVANANGPAALPGSLVGANGHDIVQMPAA
jgi:hypothetical protein